MASLEEIASRFPKAIEELQRSNERAAEDARVSQNRELRDLRKAVRESTDKRTKEHIDNKEKLRRLNENIREAAKKEEELAKTSAGQAMALKKELEDNGKIAKDNKKFQKLSYQARQQDYAQRLKDATSPAAKKEIREEARADAKKNGSRLDKIAAGIGGLWEIGKKGLKTAALGGLAILSTLAIGAFMIALGKFLQSDTFKDMTKFIQEEILPYLTEIGIAIASIVGAVAIAKFIAAAEKVRAAFLAVQTFMLGTMEPETKKMTGGVAGTFKKAAERIKNAFIAVKTFMLKTMLPAVKGMIGSAMSAGKNSFVAVAGLIRKAFTAVRTFMLLTMLPAVTAFMTPLLPIIAAAAAVSFIL